MFKTKKIISLLVVLILIFSSFVIPVSAQHVTFNFVSSKPTVNENSCYLEIVTSSGFAFVFYVSIISYTNVSEVNHASFSFYAQLENDGNLWVYALPQDSSIYVTRVVSAIIVSDGSISEGFNRGTSSGVYVGNPYISIKGYNCYGTFSGANAVFSYSNEININNKLDTIISFLQNGNQQIIDNANQNSQQIQQNQNDNTDKIINNQNQLQENEKNDASSTGGGGVDDIGSIIPNDSQGFISSINNLVGVMSYNGTNCNWELPSVSLPKIDGVMPEIKLWDKKEIPFEYWISQIPSGIITLVQSLLTIALIVYCFKELYSIISYVLTLKGGGSSE